MYKSADTETTGLEILHGARGFYFSSAWEDGTLFTLGGPDKPWAVDVHTRQVSVPKDDAKRLHELITDSDTTWIFQNAKYDTRVIDAIFQEHGLSFNPVKFLGTVEETLLQSHCLNSGESHGLKDLALKYLDISDSDQRTLHQMINQCRDFARRLGWAIASPESCPLYTKAPKAGWHVMDMWLPLQVANYLESRGYNTLSTQFTTAALRDGVNEYGGTDAIRTLGLFFPFKQMLEEENLTQMYKEQKLLLPVTYKMETNGVSIHYDELLSEIDRLTRVVTEHTQKAAKACNQPKLNIRSSKQMQAVIYDYFRRPVTKTTNKGGASTDKSVLEDILRETSETPDSDFHSFAFHITCASKSETTLTFLESYKRLALRYSAALPRKTPTNQFLWRLHPNFNITGTDTTRFSSSNPNGQNIGKGKDPFIASIYEPQIGALQLLQASGELSYEQSKNLQQYINYLTEFQNLGLSVRKIFGPAPDREWWSVDYVQLQLVIFAYVSGEPSMIKAIIDGMDFHDFMARKIFSLKDHQKPDEGQRRIAKNVNFGFIFGAGPAKIEATAKMPGLYDILKQLFPNATKFIESNAKQAKKNGYVYAAGYKLSVPEDKSYAATNYRIQGWEGRIVKRAMVYCDDYITDYCSDLGFLTLNVHDELVFDFARGTGQKHIGHLCNLMEVAGSELGIPCRVDAKYIEKQWNKGVEVNFTCAA